jgi:hypothetical protein
VAVSFVTGVRDGTEMAQQVLYQTVTACGALPARPCTGGEPRASDETTALRWATETDIAQLADQAYAIRILDALHDENPPAIRQHDGVHLL